MIKVIWPEYITLLRWSAELVASYPDEPLPLLTEENKFNEWGAIVANTGVFKRAAIPSPTSLAQGKKVSNFKDWGEWAKVVYNLMANERNIN
jgi:hypothetical protein